MTTDTTEKGLEVIIEKSLLEQSLFRQAFSTDYDRDLCLNKRLLFEFIKETQPIAFETIVKRGEDKFLKRLTEQVKQRGIIDVLRKGVKDLDLKRIKELDAGSWFSPQFSGEKIPTLWEVCDSLKGKIYLNIELTNYAASLDNLPRKVAEIIKTSKMEKEVLISSFNPVNLIQFSRVLPGIPLAILTTRGWAGKVVSRVFGGNWMMNILHPHFSEINSDSIRGFRQKYIKVHPWTINDPGRMKTLLDLGVDGIITDFPEIGLDYVRKINAN